MTTLLSGLPPGTRFALSRPSAPGVTLPGIVLSSKPPTRTRLSDGTRLSDPALVTVRVDVGGQTGKQTAVWCGDTEVEPTR